MTQVMETDTFLEHHGVKGMKWGAHKAKPTATDIHSARARTESQVRQINNQIDKTNVSSGKAQSREAKKLAEMQMNHLRDPDRATALRLTRGEKVLLGVLGVAGGPIGIAAIGTGVGVRRVARGRVEKQQQAMADARRKR